MWEIIKVTNPKILSATPHPNDAPTCAEEKRLWCETNLSIPGEHVHTVRRSQKKDFATTDGKPNLLIDDHRTTVSEWRNMGGVAIWHNTIPETIKQLIELGY